MEALIKVGWSAQTLSVSTRGINTVFFSRIRWDLLVHHASGKQVSCLYGESVNLKV